jgi:hypothetical protein
MRQVRRININSSVICGFIGEGQGLGNDRATPASRIKGVDIYGIPIRTIIIPEYETTITLTITTMTISIAKQNQKEGLVE